MFLRIYIVIKYFFIKIYFGCVVNVKVGSTKLCCRVQQLVCTQFTMQEIDTYTVISINSTPNTKNLLAQKLNVTNIVIHIPATPS